MSAIWIVAQQATQGPTSTLGMLAPFAMIFLIFWFFVWRPQAKQQAQHKSFLEGLKVGDEVVSSGGILGKVVQVDKDIIHVEVSRGSRLRILRPQIQALPQSLGAAATPKASDTEKPKGADKSSEKSADAAETEGEGSSESRKKDKKG